MNSDRLLTIFPVAAARFASQTPRSRIFPFRRSFAKLHRWSIRQPLLVHQVAYKPSVKDWKRGLKSIKTLVYSILLHFDAKLRKISASVTRGLKNIIKLDLLTSCIQLSAREFLLQQSNCIRLRVRLVAVTATKRSLREKSHTSDPINQQFPWDITRKVCCWWRLF